MGCLLRSGQLQHYRLPAADELANAVLDGQVLPLPFAVHKRRRHEICPGERRHPDFCGKNAHDQHYAHRSVWGHLLLRLYNRQIGGRHAERFSPLAAVCHNAWVLVQLHQRGADADGEDACLYPLHTAE